MAASTSRQRGLSIVELMVSVAISVAVLSSLVYVYVGSRAAYRTNEALARLQETGRFALEWIARDLRQAGYMGCLSRDAPVTVYSYEKNKMPPVLGVGPPILGWESTTQETGGEYVFSNPTTVNRTGAPGDVIAINALDGALAYVDKDYENGDPANTKVAACQGFKKGDVLVITDCSRAGVFTVTDNVNCNNGQGTITHSNSSNGWPKGQCPYAGNVTCSEDFKFSPQYSKLDQAIIASFAQVGYFIGKNRANRWALYRFRSTGAAEEVIENVEDLDLLFGVDTDPRDGSVGDYLKADDVTKNGQWDRVLSVRVSLVAVSAEAVASSASIGQVLHVRDTTGDTVVDAQTAPADRRLRQVFSTTVALRNRLP